MGGWFSKKESEDYEQILSALALSIASRQTRLSEIRLRERRATLLFTLYTLAAWGLYVAVWYLGWLPRGYRRADKLQEALRAIPVFIGPIIVLFMRRIVQWWYHRIGNAEEKTLRALLVEQRTKIEEIKKKTNYYSTRNLLERYDGPPGPARPQDPNQALRQRAPAQGNPSQMKPTAGGPPAAGGVPPVTPQSQKQPQPQQQTKAVPANGNTMGPPQAGQPSSIFTPSPMQPQSPPSKQWYDRVADALLGDDTAAAGSPAADSRYALICEKCFSHNGLVKESQWEDSQYLCPRCGHFNASPRSKALAAHHASHSRSVSPIAPHLQGHLHPELAASRSRGRRSPSPVPSSPLRHAHDLLPSSSPPSSPTPSTGKAQPISGDTEVHGMEIDS